MVHLILSSHLITSSHNLSFVLLSPRTTTGSSVTGNRRRGARSREAAAYRRSSTSFPPVTGPRESRPGLELLLFRRPAEPRPPLVPLFSQSPSRAEAVAHLFQSRPRRSTALCRPSLRASSTTCFIAADVFTCRVPAAACRKASTAEPLSCSISTPARAHPTRDGAMEAARSTRCG